MSDGEPDGQQVASIPLRDPSWWGWPGGLAVALLGIAILATDRSAAGVLAGGAALLVGAFTIAVLVDARRSGRIGRGRTITVTRDRISAPAWTLDVERVDNVWIGSTAGVAMLFIRPRERTDIQWTRSASRFLRGLHGAGSLGGHGALGFPRRALAIPLEDALRIIEATTGRSFAPVR